MRGALMICTLLAVVGGGMTNPSYAAVPAKPPASYPPAVQKLVGENAASCRQMTGRSGKSANMVRKLDVNGDGLADYLVFGGAYICPGAISSFTPTAASGVPTFLFLGRANGKIQQAWTGNSWGAKIAGRGRRTTITFPMSGSVCGDDRGGKVSVADRYSCDLKLRPDAQGRWAYEIAP
jgi:hypothetical protein